MGWRTIERSADEHSGENGLLSKVQRAWDLWGVRIIGPGFWRVRHVWKVCSRGGIGFGGGEGCEGPGVKEKT